MKAVWKGKVIAQSNETVEVEGNAYFPQEAVNPSYIKPSSHQSYCPWKGEASYYHVEVDGEVNRNAAWYYPNPKDAAKQIENYVAFWHGVEVKQD